ncbi:hypothetical protein EJB05_26926, partial [Eragrostis curvula]
MRLNEWKGRVAGEVELVLAMAEGAEEGDDDGFVHAGVAGLAQATLVLVPAPVDGDVAGAAGESTSQLQGQKKCQEQAASFTALDRHLAGEICWLIG